MPTFAASGSHQAPIPSLIRPGARSSSVEKVAASSPTLRVQLLTTPEPTAIRDGDRGVGGHRHGRLADEPALGLPDGLEAALLGELHVPHPVADRVLVLQVERDAAFARDGHAQPPFGSKVCGSIVVEPPPEALGLQRAPRRRARRWSTRASRRSSTAHSPATITSRTERAERPKIQWPAKLAASTRRRRVVVEDDEVGGRARLERPEQRLAEARARRGARPRRAARAASRRRRARSSSLSRKYAACDSSNMSEPIPSVPSATLRAECADARAADRVVHVRAGVVRERGVRRRGRARSRASSRWTPCASSVRSSSAPARASRSATRTPKRASASRSSARSSAACTCRPTPKLGGGGGARGERLVGERERRVRADHPAGERRARSRRTRSRKRRFSAIPAAARRVAVAVARLVAEDRADAERAERLARSRRASRRSRSARRGGRRASSCRRAAPPSRRRAPRRGRLLVERAVEPPPDALQDLDEVRRRLERVRHPAGERRVEVGVRADVARDDQAAGAVAPRPRRARRRRPRRSRPSSTRTSPRHDPHGVERGDDGRAGEDHARRLSRAGGRRGAARRRAPPASPSSAGACAGCRRRRSSAPATAAAVGTSAASPMPLAPYGPSGCGTSTRMHSTSGMPGRRDDVQRLQRLGHGHAALDDELLRERLAEPHVDAALDLALGEHRVQRLADVVGGDDLHEPALVVEDRDLRAPAVGEVRDRLVGVEARSSSRRRTRRGTPGRRARRAAGPRAPPRASARRRSRRCRRARSRARRSSGPSRGRARCRRATRTRVAARARARCRRSGRAPCSRPAPSPSRSGRASPSRRPRAAGSRGRTRSSPLPMPVFLATQAMPA